MTARSLLWLVCLPLTLNAGVNPLAVAGPLSLGDGGRDALGAEAGHRVSSFELPFSLAVKQVVWAEAEGLRFVNLDSNAAPEVFFDDQYLGPLRAEHGQSWRCPQGVELAAGSHRLILRNAKVRDAEDFVLRRIFVYADAPEKARSAVTVVEKMPVESATPIGPELGRACVPKQRRDWPLAFKNGITLSVLSGQVIPSGTLVALKNGEAWACGLKVSGHSSKPLALLASFRKLSGNNGRWMLGLDPDPPALVEEVGFKSAHWEKISVQLCDGLLSIQFGHSPTWKTAWPLPEIDFEVAAQSVEIALRPIP